MSVGEKVLLADSVDFLRGVIFCEGDLFGEDYFCSKVNEGELHRGDFNEVVGIEFPGKFLASKELSDEILAKNACLFVMRCSTCSIESSIHPHPTSISKTETLLSLDAILRLVAPEEDDDTQPRIPAKYLVLQTWWRVRGDPS